jgi:hypothetical protein
VNNPDILLDYLSLSDVEIKIWTDHVVGAKGSYRLRDIIKGVELKPEIKQTKHAAEEHPH